MENAPFRTAHPKAWVRRQDAAFPFNECFFILMPKFCPPFEWLFCRATRHAQTRLILYRADTRVLFGCRFAIGRTIGFAPTGWRGVDFAIGCGRFVASVATGVNVFRLRCVPRESSLAHWHHGSESGARHLGWHLRAAAGCCYRRQVKWLQSTPDIS